MGVNLAYCAEPRHLFFFKSYVIVRRRSPTKKKTFSFSSFSSLPCWLSLAAHSALSAMAHTQYVYLNVVLSIPGIESLKKQVSRPYVVRHMNSKVSGILQAMLFFIQR